jgi:hypothetical protein
MQLIVLGMHRSGTSVLARLLNMMGAYFAAEGMGIGANQENPKGFWERRDVRALNDLLLHSVGCDWNRVVNFDCARVPEPVLGGFAKRAARIVLDMDAHRPWLLKEPRLCLLFPLWRGLLEVPHCIHIYRSPLEVARSLQKRNGIPPEAGYALWEKYNVEAFNASAGLPRILVSHHQLMREPESVTLNLYDQLAEFGIQGLRKPMRQEIAAFVRSDLYRERSEPAEPDSCLNPDQLALFESIKSGRILSGTQTIPFSEKGRLALSNYEAALGPPEKSRKAAASIETVAGEPHADIKQLNDIVRQLLRGADNMARSRSWKLARFLSSLRYRLLLKAVPPAAKDPITVAKNRYESWKRSKIESDGPAEGK